MTGLSIREEIIEKRTVEEQRDCLQENFLESLLLLRERRLWRGF